MTFRTIVMNEELLNRLLEEARPFASAIGQNPTGIPGFLVVRRESAGEKRSFSKLYAAAVLQGSKSTTINGHTLNYGRGNLVVNCIERPSVTCIREASAERPFLSLIIELERQELLDLAMSANTHGLRQSAPDNMQHPIFVTQADEEILSCFLRLTQLLRKSKNEQDLLAPILKKEIYARLAIGPLGKWILSVCTLGTRSNQISSAVEMIQSGFRKALNVEDIARTVNMSPATFHRHFKILTGVSPLQFLKSLRLYEARRLILSGHSNISQAAYDVGYASPSQFSNDYRTAFGLSPQTDKNLHAA